MNTTGDIDENSIIRSKTQLLDYLTEFVEVAIHMILYTREVYPPTIFTRVKRFNVPVFISNFDKLFDYISNISDAVKPLFFQDLLREISVTIASTDRIALEKFSLRLSCLNPVILGAFKNSKNDEIEAIDKSSLESILRSFLIKLSTADSYFKPLPENVTFYVTIETNGDLDLQTQKRMQGELNQKFPWILANLDSCTAFDDSLLTPLKSLHSEVFKIELFAREINKN